jgi:hypothetical protein
VGARAHVHKAATAGYERRRPEQTLLYRTVAEHWRAFLSQADEHGGLPKFVVREVEDYLDCGILERGTTVTYYVQPSKYAGAGDDHASAPSVA